MCSNWVVTLKEISRMPIEIFGPARTFVFLSVNLYGKQSLNAVVDFASLARRQEHELFLPVSPHLWSLVSC